MIKVYERPKSLVDTMTHYCPGCTHGIVHRLVAEVLDELDILDRTIGVSSVGCSVLSNQYFACDMQQAAHGRAPAVATGIKRVVPDGIVFTYQGDGDLASIGCAEIVHAAVRGENFTTIFVNNGIFGMTGGQMAPTTLPGQITTTTPYGRNTKTQGFPIKVCEMLTTQDGPAFIARVSVHNNANIIKARKAIKKAFEYQLGDKGFTLIEVLSTCPTNWGLTPRESMDKIANEIIPFFPLGEYKDIEAGEPK